VKSCGIIAPNRRSVEQIYKFNHKLAIFEMVKDGDKGSKEEK